jgi:hypothetical protein
MICNKKKITVFWDVMADSTNVLEELAASVFRTEESSSAPKIKAISSYETFVPIG